MTGAGIRKETEPYLASFRQRNGTSPGWVRRLREEGITRFAELGFPTPRLEDWKYTSVAPIASRQFRIAPPLALDGPIREAAAAARIDGAVEIVFVNGRYASELSSVGSLPGGVLVTSLAAALERHGDLLETHVGRSSDVHGESFTALNTAFFEDGAFVYAPRGAWLEAPVHLLHLSAPEGDPIFLCPRTLIVAEESSVIEIVESHIGTGDGVTFANAVTEIVVGRGASVAHYKIQRESREAFHVATIEARQQADSRFLSHSVSLGGSLSRAAIRTVLEDEGGECRLNGLYVTGGTQHVDHHTTIDHRKPRCSSRELYKGVLDGRSTGVFNGKVYVRPDAQKSDAQQVNKNLLLSEAATINTKPELQIFADDVKCSHGATIGRLDENALYYLRSRGIDAETARELLIYAFSNELVEQIRIAPLREDLDRRLETRLREAPSLEALS